MGRQELPADTQTSRLRCDADLGEIPVRLSRPARIEERCADPRRTESLAALTASARPSPELVTAARSESALARERTHTLVAEWAAAHPTAAINIDRAATGIHAAAEGIAGWWLATRDDTGIAEVIQTFAGGIASSAGLMQAPDRSSTSAPSPRDGRTIR